MTTLYLVRHGETVDNARHILQGQEPGRLNETGVRQAEEVRDKMKNAAIDVFMASDLRRAIQTCEIIAAPHHKPVETTPLLRERDWGDFTGCYIPDLQTVTEWPENVESLESIKNRARDFLAMVKTKYRDKTVLAVGHGIVNKAVQSVFFNKPMKEVEKMSNAEVRMLIL
ncbi:histidine phosphatase family protein [Prevotella sp. A2931]|uniref:Histidine phosphatase family protein n=1 Tax=Prevotella illustrans TaxID=2800387 RepID=A0ABS3M405_9BACT|nr:MULTISPECIES: histidine phosphatase family protein [Prevotella]MBO1362910.1 histidine phosphatase family protein [Prevotella illustrans]PTL27410.1 histidine phosphatase family protein [Prevotella sp. oral taxon 820]